MLMQNFKAADDLGITEPQKDALIKTLVLLETGKLVHVPKYQIKSLEGDSGFTGHFNMNSWTVEGSCGTVACIGGTAELVGGLERDSLEDVTNRNAELDLLFYPNLGRYDWGLVTVEQAATALRSFLTTGSARWDLAVP